MRNSRLYNALLKGAPQRNATKWERLRWKRHVAIRALLSIPPIWIVLIFGDVSTWMLVVFAVVTLISIGNVVVLSIRVDRNSDA